MWDWAKILKKYSVKKHSFLHNVRTLMVGTVLVQVLAVLMSPVITRLYTPNDMGVFASYTAVVNIITPVMCLGYELAVVLPKKERVAANIFGLSFIALSVLTILSIPFAIFGDVFIGKAFGSSDILAWHYFLPISFFLAGIFQIFSYWGLRRKRFKGLTVARVGQSSAALSGQVGMGYFMVPAGAGGLIFSQIAGRFIGNIVLLKTSIKKDIGFILKNISLADLRSAALRYKKFFYYGTWPTFLDNLTVAMPVLFMAYFYGAHIAGIFALCMRVILIPVAMIHEPLSKALHQKLAELLANKHSIALPVEKTFRKLFLIALVLLLLMLLSPLAFGFIFGDSWAEAGMFALILAPSVAIRFIVSPLSIALVACDRQDVAAIWKVAALVSTAALLGISLLFAEPRITLLFLTANDLLLYSFYLGLIFRVTRSDIFRACGLNGRM